MASQCDGTRIGVIACLVLLGGVVPVRAGEAIDYNRQVLPILSDHCYRCHGPDEGSRKAHLRLDTREGAFRVKEGRAVIAPGHGDASELISRITNPNPEKLMPPPDAHRKLTPAQIETIRAWVDQGAKWATHWALIAPARPPVPEVSDDGWPRNAVDHFVLAELKKQGLAPSPPATLAALLRRVSLDLTGLPPSPEAREAFLADSRPDAYERLVDRLLASPRYGERMATPWLDLARYADTHGYQADRYRAMWAYRDWVIKSFNENQPYDQFVIWQLAGDLLPNATKEQRLATAFNRLHMQNEEGGIVEEEYRVAYNVDRVDTFGTAFLGLTFECSRCHDHKFDPITQKDFYSLFSFFQNVDEAGQTPYFTEPLNSPTLMLSDAATDQKLAALAEKIAGQEQRLRHLRGEMAEPFQKWLASKGPLPKLAGLVAEYRFDAIEGWKLVNTVDRSKPAIAVENPKLVEDEGGKAVELSGENGFHFPSVGHFSRVDPFSLSVRLKTSSNAPRVVVLHHSKAPIDAGSRGYELLLEGGRVAFGLHHMWPGNSLKVVTKQAVAIDRWTQITVSYDGSSSASGIRIYLDGRPADLEVVRDNLRKDITYGGAEPDLALGYRFRDNGFKGGRVDELRVFDRALTPPEAEQLAGSDDFATAWNASPEQLTPAQRDGLMDYFADTTYEPMRQDAEELHALRREQNALVNPIPEIMVMQELPVPKPAFILKRGAYDAHGDEVHATTPSALPPMPPDEPRNRLGLAHWLFSKQNPLTARVAVNRLWQQMFGSGIVQTSDNFGSQGSPPSHPELLDWLACEYQKDWDTKRLLKLIAMSATYRQSSRGSAELLARDPDNRLLARGPARRLSAEMLRDQALADAGLLVEKLGGPSVKPYQPPGLWDVAMNHPTYDQGHGDDLHRRSLYTFWKRTVPPPTMMAFDAPDRNYCVARRQSTSTPLQALAMLNDVQITEAARFISQRTIREGGDRAQARIAWMFRLITDRDPAEKEQAILKQLFDEQRETFAADPDAVKKLLSAGETKNDASLDPLDLAAGAVLAEAILNHDDALMRR